MPRPLQLAELAGVVLACAGVAVLHVQVRKLRRRQVAIMAKFDMYDEAWAEHKQAITDAVGRVQQDVDALLAQVASDATDQDAIDERTAALRDSTSALGAIDPVKPAGDGGEPTDTTPPTA